MENRFRFRCWNKKEKTMHYDAEKTYDFMKGKPVICEESFGELLENKDYIVMQCVGLKDKNGKLIYEGDIVKTRTGLRLKVIWNKEAAMFWLQTFDEVYTITFYAKQQLDGDEMEVIGNIYENKELLNGNKN